MYNKWFEISCVVSGIVHVSFLSAHKYCKDNLTYIILATQQGAHFMCMREKGTWFVCSWFLLNFRSKLYLWEKRTFISMDTSNLVFWALGRDNISTCKKLLSNIYIIGELSTRCVIDDMSFQSKLYYNDQTNMIFFVSFLTWQTILGVVLYIKVQGKQIW